MGDANIGRGRSHDGFSFSVAFGVLGQANGRRNDFNSYDGSSYDAFDAMRKESADLRLVRLWKFAGSYDL